MHDEAEALALLCNGCNGCNGAGGEARKARSQPGERKVGGLVAEVERSREVWLLAADGEERPDEM